LTDKPSVARFTFPPSHRLSGRLAFRRVFDEGRKAGKGPMVLYALANDLGHPRLGLTVPRRVGDAVRRNRVKRHLREIYRHLRQDLPACDFVIVVRPHPHHRLMRPQSSYRTTLENLLGKVIDYPKQQPT
jgi:ribonuclease P protein component